MWLVVLPIKSMESYAYSFKDPKNKVTAWFSRFQEHIYANFQQRTKNKGNNQEYITFPGENIEDLVSSIKQSIEKPFDISLSYMDYDPPDTVIFNRPTAHDDYFLLRRMKDTIDSCCALDKTVHHRSNEITVIIITDLPNWQSLIEMMLKNFNRMNLKNQVVENAPVSDVTPLKDRKDSKRHLDVMNGEAKRMK